LIRFGQILTKHQVNQIIWNDVPIAPEWPQWYIF
jgi:hypothetical protein